MKHEWKKKEKELYLPPTQPVFIDVPEFKFIHIKGEGNPNSEQFSMHVQTLYALSYGIKMSHKKGIQPAGYFDYTVYPLEGIWDLKQEAKKNFTGSFKKEDLVYDLMIRQPEFVTQDFFSTIKEMIGDKKKALPVDEAEFIQIKDGPCVQMMHIGSYDDEPASFTQMDKYTHEQGMTRLSKKHREIYISDARRVNPEKLKTVLRFKVR